ncbi:chromosome segregation ATPase-like protein [Aurantimonas litoralis]|nr:chromosome segregation ATPase-like protein [Aurantimonas litoralis]
MTTFEIFTIVAGFLAAIAVFQIFLAIRHDQVVTARGPVESLTLLEERIAAKRSDLAEVEETLRKRSEALENVASFQAEVDALIRQRDDLIAEWNSRAEQREEVRALREETEQALNEKLAVDGDLRNAREELEAANDRIAQAENLDQRIADLRAQFASLTAEADALRTEKARLAEAVGQARQAGERLREAQQQLQEIERRRVDLETATTEAAAGLADCRGDLREVQSARDESRQQLINARAEHEHLEERRNALQMKITILEAEIEAHQPQPGRSNGSPAIDPLAELKIVPMVIESLTTWPKSALMEEADALSRVEERLQATGLSFPQRIVHAFHTAMKVNETSQMTVLAGISGTGKSQLPRVYAAGMGIGFLQAPVQPRWDSPQDLMGFYNYIEGRFRPTDMARALFKLDSANNPDALKDRMMMVLLDEMNLARVEYYFSDFLSRLESRPPHDRVTNSNARKDAEIELEIPMAKGERAPRIFPGYNLLFAGTMNEDESTQSLSDKVIDRANVMRFTAPRQIQQQKSLGDLASEEALPHSRWRSWVKPISGAETPPLVAVGLNSMMNVMKGFHRPFGHRLGRAILAYAANYPTASGGQIWHRAMADQMEMRLLPKLRGIEVDTFGDEFDELRRLADHDFKDQALAEAIGQSVEAAQEGSGQFTWLGVER